jgi:hypothetical protein
MEGRRTKVTNGTRDTRAPPKEFYEQYPSIFSLLIRLNEPAAGFNVIIDIIIYN